MTCPCARQPGDDGLGLGSVCSSPTPFPHGINKVFIYPSILHKLPFFVGVACRLFKQSWTRSLPTNSLTSLTLKSGSGILEREREKDGEREGVSVRFPRPLSLGCPVRACWREEGDLLDAEAVRLLEDEGVPQALPLDVLEGEVCQDTTERPQSHTHTHTHTDRQVTPFQIT